MSGIIIDGTGTGLRAKVNQRNEIQTQSRAIPHSALKCVAGQVFLLSFPFYTIDTTGGRIGWMVFSDPVYYLVLDQLIVSWNGGSTTGTKALRVEYVIGDTQPTTGTIPYGAGNSNTLSTNSLNATILAWDGVTGSGITGHTPGVSTGRVMAPQGYTISPVEGKMIIGSGISLSINMKAEETGVGSFTGYFYLFDPEVDG